MIYPLIDKDIWSKRYDIDISKGNCIKCGCDVVADIPFADGKLRGFVSEDHGCGDRFTHVVFKCEIEDLFDEDS